MTWIIPESKSLTVFRLRVRYDGSALFQHKSMTFSVPVAHSFARDGAALREKSG